MRPDEMVIIVRRMRGVGFRATLPAGRTVEATGMPELHERVRAMVDVPALRAAGISALRLELTVTRRDGLPVCWREDVIALEG